MDARLSTAVIAGKVAGILSRNLGAGSGTTVPGEIASRIDPAALSKLSERLSRGSIIVTGTNGKTTTARLISNILRAAGWRAVHNRAGANMLGGLTSALVSDSGIQGDIPADCGLFEVDEAVMPTALFRLKPRLTVITNLFRDQLDRYGEISYLANMWRNAIASLPKNAAVFLNADDPSVAALGRGIQAKVIYYGIDDETAGSRSGQHTADSTTCPDCGSGYDYEVVFYSHIGIYRCPKCGLGRPRPDISAVQVDTSSIEGSQAVLRTQDGRLTLKIPFPCLYNVYNALAAASVGLAVNIQPEGIQAAIQGSTAAFGRMERIQLGDKSLVLSLVKNPVGCNQTISTILEQGGEAKKPNLLIIINDNIADGTDVSWLWDVDFENLAGRVNRITVGGTRAEDMMLRLKYAGFDMDNACMAGSAARSLRRALAETPEGHSIYVLPTYTAMLEVRKTLAQRGVISGYLEE